MHHKHSLLVQGILLNGNKGKHCSNHYINVLNQQQKAKAINTKIYGTSDENITHQQSTNNNYYYVSHLHSTQVIKFTLAFCLTIHSTMVRLHLHTLMVYNSPHVSTR